MRDDAVTLVIKEISPDKTHRPFCVCVFWLFHLLDDGNLLPVLEELLHTLVRQRMFQQLIENLCRHCADIGADQTRLHDVNRMCGWMRPAPQS